MKCGRMILNSGLRDVWKEAVLVFSNPYLDINLERTRKTKINASRNGCTRPGDFESEPVVSLLCQGDWLHAHVVLCRKNEVTNHLQLGETCVWMSTA